MCVHIKFVKEFFIRFDKEKKEMSAVANRLLRKSSPWKVQ